MHGFFSDDTRFVSRWLLTLDGRELDAFAEIYNEAWSRNFGFVPYSKEDLDAYAQELQLVYDKPWFMIAEDSEGKTVGMAITVPDINQVLKRMNGRILPFGWWHFLRRRKGPEPPLGVAKHEAGFWTKQALQGLLDRQSREGHGDRSCKRALARLRGRQDRNGEDSPRQISKGHV